MDALRATPSLLDFNAAEGLVQLCYCCSCLAIRDSACNSDRAVLACSRLPLARLYHTSKHREYLSNYDVVHNLHRSCSLSSATTCVYMCERDHVGIWHE